MKEIIKNIANMLKVKTVVTLLVMLVFCVLALRGTIEPDQVTQITLMVIAFYFGTQHEKKANI